jgi:hypothetical protein
MDIFKSEVAKVNCNIEKVYGMLSNPESFNTIAERLPEEALANLKGKASFDKDSITIDAAPVGEVKLNIVERIEPNRVVFAAAQSPVPLQLVISLEKVSDNETNASAELGVELNPFIRPMLSKPLQDGANKFGELLSKIPFELL